MLTTTSPQTENLVLQKKTGQNKGHMFFIVMDYLSHSPASWFSQGIVMNENKLVCLESEKSMENHGGVVLIQSNQLHTRNMFLKMCYMQVFQIQTWAATQVSVLISHPPSIPSNNTILYLKRQQWVSVAFSLLWVLHEGMKKECWPERKEKPHYVMNMRSDRNKKVEWELTLALFLQCWRQLMVSEEMMLNSPGF